MSSDFIGVCTKCMSPVYCEYNDDYECYMILQSCRCDADLERKSPTYYYHVLPAMARLVLIGIAYIAFPAIPILFWGMIFLLIGNSFIELVSTNNFYRDAEISDIIEIENDRILFGKLV